MEQVAMTQMPNAQMVNGLNDYGIYNRYHRRTRRRQTRVYITTRVYIANGVCRSPSIHLQHGEECRLRHLYLPYLTHTFLTGLLLFKEFAFTRYVAAVALRRHILTHGLHRLAGDDLGADGSLYGYVELLTRDQLLEFLAHLAAEVVGVVGIYERREGVDGLAIEQDVELRQTARLVARTVVIERRISPSRYSSACRKVEDDLRQWHVEVYLDTVLRNERLVLHHAALVDA